MNTAEEDTLIKITTSDHQEYELPVAWAERSKTLHNLMCDLGTDDPIPLPQVSSKAFSKIMVYLDHVQHLPVPTYISEETAVELQYQGREEELSEKVPFRDLDPWDVEFCDLTQEDLFELTVAANYLHIVDLLDITTTTIANMLKGKTAEEMRATFGLKNDFTPEEEKRILEENLWMEQATDTL